MWRWSCWMNQVSRNHRVFSTYVEVILSFTKMQVKSACFLHVCGGDPDPQNASFCQFLFSPRMWRWSYVWNTHSSRLNVFSTYVEVILTPFFKSCAFCCFLHVCGGDPEWRESNYKVILFSPRMWRWSYWLVDLDRVNTVFSTYVEVILVNYHLSISYFRFLHVCGGDPNLFNAMLDKIEFSPRMWRWSWVSPKLISSISVFSTYVEVILTSISSR